MDNVNNRSCHYTKEEAEIIAKENYGLIYHILGTLNLNGYTYDDAFEAGMYGYTKAIQTFDKSKNILFSTYACNCIRNEVLAYMKKEVKYVNNISLNQKVGENENNVELEEILEFHMGENKKTDDIMFFNNDINELFKALTKLTEEERYIIIHRYGIGNHKIMRQKEIAESLNMSQANVSKTENIALKKLKIYVKINSRKK